MSPDEMEGSGQARDLVQAAMLKRGGSPGPISDEKVSQAILRPGVISWDSDKDSGVWFNIKKDGGQSVSASAQGLQIGKILSSRYVQSDVAQGRDVMEFPKKQAPTAVDKAEARMIANVKAAQDASEVEAGAKALASRARATKEAAMAGLAGLGYFGDAGRLAAANERFAKAQAAAFSSNGSCSTGPAFTCNPQLMADFTSAQKELAAAAKEAGDQEAMKKAADAQADIVATQGKKIKILVGVIAALVVGAGIYFMKKGS